MLFADLRRPQGTKAPPWNCANSWLHLARRREKASKCLSIWVSQTMKLHAISKFQKHIFQSSATSGAFVKKPSGSAWRSLIKAQKMEQTFMCLIRSSANIASRFLHWNLRTVRCRKGTAIKCLLRLRQELAWGLCSHSVPSLRFKNVCI